MWKATRTLGDAFKVRNLACKVLLLAEQRLFRLLVLALLFKQLCLELTDLCLC